MLFRRFSRRLSESRSKISFSEAESELARRPAQPLGIRNGAANKLWGFERRASDGDGRAVVAKGQQRSNKEARKPKKAKAKTIAANPSQKGGPRGLEHLKND